MENLRLGVSAVRHDMKREETVEEVEKNTEWQRRTPKRNVVSSSLAGGAKMTAVSHFLMVYSGFYFPLPTGELCREREIFIRFYCIVCCRLPDSAESCLKSLCITASFLDLDHKRQKPIIRAPKG